MCTLKKEMKKERRSQPYKQPLNDDHARTVRPDCLSCSRFRPCLSGVK